MDKATELFKKLAARKMEDFYEQTQDYFSGVSPKLPDYQRYEEALAEEAKAWKGQKYLKPVAVTSAAGGLISVPVALARAKSKRGKAGTIAAGVGLGAGAAAGLVKMIKNEGRKNEKLIADRPTSYSARKKLRGKYVEAIGNAALDTQLA